MVVDHPNRREILEIDYYNAFQVCLEDMCFVHEYMVVSVLFKIHYWTCIYTMNKIQTILK